MIDGSSAAAAANRREAGGRPEGGGAGPRRTQTCGSKSSSVCEPVCLLVMVNVGHGFWERNLLSNKEKIRQI